MKNRRLDPTKSIHNQDPVRVEIAGKTYRAFPVTNSNAVPEIFCRSLTEARHIVALQELPNVLYKLRDECSDENADPATQLRKVSNICHELIIELYKSRRSNSYATTEKTVAQLQQERIEERKAEWKAFKRGEFR